MTVKYENEPGCDDSVVTDPTIQQPDLDLPHGHGICLIASWVKVHVMQICTDTLGIAKSAVSECMNYRVNMYPLINVKVVGITCFHFLDML